MTASPAKERATFWIIDQRAAVEVSEVRRIVLGRKDAERYELLGADEIRRDLAERERYQVINFDENALDILGLKEGPRNGFIGPFNSQEEAETIAQRLNTTSD